VRESFSGALEADGHNSPSYARDGRLIASWETIFATDEEGAELCLEAGVR
jgi:hypothetical protein